MSTTTTLLDRLLKQKLVLPDIQITKKFGIAMITDELYIPELKKLTKGLRIHAGEHITLPRTLKDVPEKPWQHLWDYLCFLTSSWYQPPEELKTNINFFFDKVQIEFSFEDLDPIREDEKDRYEKVSAFAKEMTIVFDFDNEILNDSNSITVCIKRR